MPTCIVLDPAYARRRERAVVVGFADGRLILTKERGIGFIFGRRTDEVLYHGSGYGKPVDDASSVGGPPSWILGSIRGVTSENIVDGAKDDADSDVGSIKSSVSVSIERVRRSANEPMGIEAIAWRGRMIAWADETGIKILDVLSGQRIAHIDRPSGARAELFPSVGSLRCHLTWESEYKLLFGWGDCVMSMNVIQYALNIDENPETNPDPAMIKYNVECDMAWELDCCVACGIVPLDSNFLAVLGMSTGSDEILASHNETSKSDMGPLSQSKISGPPKGVIEVAILSRKTGTVVSSDALAMEDSFESIPFDASNFRMLSSYALSRMESQVEEELREEEANEGGQLLPSRRSRLEPHQQWDFRSVLNVDDLSQMIGNNKNAQSKFGFNPKIFAIPSPIMTIVSPREIILSQAHDIDDKVSHARSNGNHELALELALQGRPFLRKHSLTMLVNERLSALLEEGTLESLRYAAKSCPRLLGGSSSRWERCIYTFAKIPGGLYALREFVPVRDPKLPPPLYEMMLERMFLEIENIPLSHSLSLQVKDAFLCALRGWGPTSSLKERLKLLRWRNDGHRTIQMEETEVDLYRRFNQSAAASFISDNSRKRTITFAVEEIQPQDLPPLYDIDGVVSRLVSRLDGDITEHTSSTVIRSIAALEAVAELSLCKKEYKEALRLFMIIGFYFKPDVDEEALQSVNYHTTSSTSGHHRTIEACADEPHLYQHIIALIEDHTLHQLFLSDRGVDSDFIAKGLAKNDKGSHVLSAAMSIAEATASPSFSFIVGLIQLVGLDLAGKFLVENCSRPLTSDFMSGATDALLPVDKVAGCLSSRPKLLLWYLHQIFMHCPDSYVTFSHAIIPPAGIVELHSTHLRLYIQYGDGNSKDMSKSNIILFLKSAMNLNGAKPSEARRLLQDRRDINIASSDKSNHIFSLELAFCIEKSGIGKEDAIKVLRIYLDEVKSLSLAVQYVESVKDESGEMHHILNEILLEDCKVKGQYGELLEVTARFGGDVATLVREMPQGTIVEGLIPKLVSAIKNYHLQLKMCESSFQIFNEDKVDKMREFLHRSRRGHLLHTKKRVESMTNGSHGRTQSTPNTKNQSNHERRQGSYSRSLSQRYVRARKMQTVAVR